MKKPEFVKRIAELTGYKLIEVDLFITAFEEVMIHDIFEAEDEIVLRIGKFRGVTKKQKNLYDPRTGEPRIVPEKHGFPKFRASNMSKERSNALEEARQKVQDRDDGYYSYDGIDDDDDDFDDYKD